MKCENPHVLGSENIKFMQLEIRNLSKTYPNGVKAMNNVSLDVPQGVFGLLGPNGAGKTTLMNTLATLQEPDGGTIRLGEIDGLKDKEEVRRRLGYLPQEFGVYSGVSAEKLLDYLAQLKGIANKKTRRDHIAGLLQLVNLSADKKRAVDTFSGGMRQRFGISQALIGNPDFIIVDEPTAGLDPAERNRFHRILSEIGENTVVILSTHIVEDVTNLCSRVAVMNRGEVLLKGKPSDLIAELKGKIWEKSVDKSEISEIRKDFEIIKTRLGGGKFIVTVKADQPPAADFKPKTPDLEDVYFIHVPQENDEGYKSGKFPQSGEKSHSNMYN